MGLNHQPAAIRVNLLGSQLHAIAAARKLTKAETLSVDYTNHVHWGHFGD